MLPLLVLLGEVELCGSVVVLLGDVELCDPLVLLGDVELCEPCELCEPELMVPLLLLLRWGVVLPALP
jgi:hypothetical protein